MSETQNSKQYDLEERTLKFARAIREFVKKLPRTLSNVEDSKQLIRSSGSIGANYIEANESFGKKDFAMRVKISRKEAKESRYWLQLVDIHSKTLEVERENFMREATELMKIFGSIIERVK